MCYAQRLSRLAEQFIARGLGGRIEGDDVVQSVFRTFFRRCAGGEFQIDSSAQLWQLLVKITMTKARAQGRLAASPPPETPPQAPPAAAHSKLAVQHLHSPAPPANDHPGESLQRAETALRLATSNGESRPRVEK